ncbi:probable serine/threonine-protein kinase clkA isoform X1 [Cephus cinctus]|uniref:Probable serine/threonine-protein kinase clkA isoform X1 n=1 Tax=Cephus cinctus TaxID=211228 RepID=A0AAJ7BQQ4_CEPCN|nr:probable serine/threonine-protein kinase clkA isoform X1 [Cephus cinctus]
MPIYKTSLVIALAAIFWSCSLALQRPPPRYSQQYMPDTSFTCRNKIVGSYYADPETDCQLFHVCVSVAGSIQDYRFLCPNDTAFDQESQTCADWYDVDCEAATLYYASDNFDLYRLGSGLESLHYDSIRNDVEPQDHLQRSETSDAVRSSANNLNRVASNNGYSGNANSNSNANNNKEIFRGSSSSNFYSSRNNGKEDDYDNEKAYREENVQEPRKKVGVRKLARKQQYNGNQNNINNNSNNNNYSPSTTIAPPSAAQNPSGFNNGNYYNGNNNFNNQRVTNFASSTTARPVSSQENYNRNQNTPKYNTPTSTNRPTTNYQETYSSYQSPSTTVRTTEYNNYNGNGYNSNTQGATNYNQSPTTTVRPNNYNSRNNNNKNNNEQGFTNQYNQFNQQSQSTTIQSSTNYQQNDYTNYQHRNYNNIQRSSSSNPFQTTTAASTFYDNYSSGSNYNANNNGQYNRVSSSTITRQEPAQTTTKYFTNNYAGSSYVPTTYSPTTKKYLNNDNVQAQTKVRGSDRYNSQLTDNGQYFDKTQGEKSTQYYDSTRATKKPVQYNNYDNSGKYYESSTSNYNNYDYNKSSPGIGFSPASINHLAESPKTTTPAPRRSPGPSTYSPSTFSANTQRPQQSQTTARGATFVSGSARPFSTTKSLDATTAKPKSTKKNDYDYAYYDNAGTLEYDGLDLEHVNDNKESSKIARN